MVRLLRPGKAPPGRPGSRAPISASGAPVAASTETHRIPVSRVRNIGASVSIPKAANDDAEKARSGRRTRRESITGRECDEVLSSRYTVTTGSSSTGRPARVALSRTVSSYSLGTHRGTGSALSSGCDCTADVAHRRPASDRDHAALDHAARCLLYTSPSP